MSLEQQSLDVIKTRLLASSSGLDDQQRIVSPEADLNEYLNQMHDRLLRRRTEDLRGLPLEQKLHIIVSRAHETCLTTDAEGHMPIVEEVKQHIEALNEGQERTVLIGIDPTGSKIHMGHAVPLILVSRLQRMGFKVIFVVGDITAQIGDPTGRTSDRPALTEAEIQANFETYKEQAGRFIDFSQAEIVYNSSLVGKDEIGELMAELGGDLSRLTPERLQQLTIQIKRNEITRNLQIPAKKTLGARRYKMRDEVSLAEALYSVDMGNDAVKLKPNLQVAGYDQFDNLDMCRLMEHRLSGKKMAYITAPLLPKAGRLKEVDETIELDEVALEMKRMRDKMSKSDAASCLFIEDDEAKIMNTVLSMEDRLVVPFLKMVTEAYDEEIEQLDQLPKQAVKKMLAKLIADTVRSSHGPTKTKARSLEQKGRKMVITVEVPLAQVAQDTVIQLIISRSSGTINEAQARQLIKSRNAVRLVDMANGAVLEYINRPNLTLAQLLEKHADKSVILSVGGKNSHDFVLSK